MYLGKIIERIESAKLVCSKSILAQLKCKDKFAVWKNKFIHKTIDDNLRKFINYK
jgi:hypothetical protein